MLDEWAGLILVGGGMLAIVAGIIYDLRQHRR